MKIAIAFLLVSLHCCLGTLPTDKKDVPVVPVPKVPESAPKPVPKVPQPAPKPVPKVPQPAPKPVPKVTQPLSRIACLIQLLKNDAPVLLEKLGNLLCSYQVAQKEQNIALFMDFLKQVNNILEEVGCSLSNIIGTKVVVTAQNAEQLADQVAVVLFQFVVKM
ncbi:hypothetical protein GDO86_005509 [Hymenochirus boettgeri]|uniref:Uncharacterized protein n=1 Tax=Hymenochirus boettgeri TaxID=247094 RepID=A0A8T2J9K7_9PIPI|nr:hypothetical protein GDO86_005509 [Hymenochirus boettgeri]